MGFFTKKSFAHSRKQARLMLGLAPAILLLAMVPDAQAQEEVAETQSNDEILVQGLKFRERVIDGYVRRLTVISPTAPLPRYEPDIYCPVVLGLSESRGKEIAARMRQVAEVAGIKPAAEGCTASALLFLVDDKQSFLKAFRKMHPVYFMDPKGETWSPPKEKGPVVAWQLTQQLDPQGNAIVQDQSLGYKVVESVVGGSRILSMVKPVVAMSVIIIERDALVGLSTTQIADYALMRTFTDRSPDKMKDIQRLSILDVIETPMGGEAHASLTDWDLAYLKGRYAGDPRFYGQKQGTTIRNAMEKTLAGESDE